MDWEVLGADADWTAAAGAPTVRMRANQLTSRGSHQDLKVMASSSAALGNFQGSSR